MAITNSLSFPNMFDLARNRVGILEDNISIVNRTRLLILTEPTELYNEPNFGVGLKRHLWQYNTPNEKAIIRDRITAQLAIQEPSVDAQKTSFSDGLLYTGNADELTTQEFNTLKMTVGLSTVYGDNLNVDLNTNV